MFWGWILLLANNYIDKQFILYKNSPDAIKVISFSAIIIFLFTLTKLLFIWLEEIHKRTSSYMFQAEDWPGKWMYNGSSELIVKPSGLYIKSSRAGTLFKKHLWRNFEMNFDLEFPPYSDEHTMDYIGIVFRAQDLDNYFMIEINRKKDTNDLRVQRLVRYRGGWETSIEEKIGTITDWTKPLQISLTVACHLAKIKANNLSCEWILPSNVDLSHFESGSGAKKDENKPKYSESKSVPEIPFRTGFGMIGFRAYPGQGAIIRNLEIKSL